MLSLKDEIQKFQKLIYNQQLAQFITVDQMFAGSGITMKSLIDENSFMIEQLKKMSAAFINYCKLNEKVYNKIMEHELNIHHENDKLNNIVSNTDRKINEAIKYIKQMYQKTVLENQKAQKSFQDITLPLKEQLNKKVDNSTFSIKIKQILQQLEEGGGEERSDREESNQKAENFQRSSEAQPDLSPKKKGKVGFDEFDKFKKQFDQKQNQQAIKLQQSLKSNNQNKQLLLKYIPIINKTNETSVTHSSQLHRLSKELQNQLVIINSSNTKLMNEINSKTNDNIWNSKLSYFYDQSIKPISIQIDKNQESILHNFNQNKAQTIARFNLVENKIMQNKNQISHLNQITNHNKLQIESVNQKFSKFKQQNDHQHILFQSKILQNHNKLEKSISTISIQIQNELKTIQNEINNLSIKIAQSVLKSVTKKFEQQIKIIESDINIGKKKTKQLNNDMLMVYDQIKSIKDILSKKANFTDILLYVDKKADKVDIKQLQVKISQSHNNMSKIKSDFINTSMRTQKQQTVRRKASYTKTNKSTLANFRSDRNQFDASTKLFMCGYDGNGTPSTSNDPKPTSTVNSRRKSIKSSLPISDFNF